MGNILDLANFLQPTDGGPVVGVLPVLEEIVLCARTYSPENKAEFASGLAAFDPFVSARQEAGRPVRVLRGSTPDVSWRFPHWLGGTLPLLQHFVHPIVARSVASISSAVLERKGAQGGTWKYTRPRIFFAAK
jgi:hypothetical protein